MIIIPTLLEMTKKINKNDSDVENVKDKIKSKVPKKQKTIIESNSESDADSEIPKKKKKCKKIVESDFDELQKNNNFKKYQSVDISKLSADKLIEIYGEIMNESTLWCPKDDTNKWKKVKKYNETYCEYDGLPQVEFVITEDIINQVKKCVEIREKLGINISTKVPNKKILYICKFFNDKCEYICGTSTPMDTRVKSGLLFTLTGKPDYAFQKFKEFVGIRCVLMGCYMLEDDAVKEKTLSNKLKDEFGKNDTKLSQNNEIYEKVESDMNKLYELYKKNMDILMKQSDDKSYNFYIYQLISVDDENQQYVLGSNKKMKLVDVKKKLLNYGVAIKNCELHLLEKTDVKLECQGLLLVDYYIIQKESISKGLNKCHNVIVSSICDNEKINEFLFLMIQRELLKLRFVDDVIEYDSAAGYIVCVDVNGARYVFGEKTNKTVKKKLYDMYTVAMYGNKKSREYLEYSQLIDEMKKTEYIKINVSLIESFIDIDDIESMILYYKKATGIKYITIDDQPEKKAIPKKVFHSWTKK